MKKYTLIACSIIFLCINLFTYIALASRYKASDVVMMASVLWHEAGGSGYTEMHKVANVIMNRFEKYQGHNKEGYQLEIGDVLTYKQLFQGSAAYLNSRMTDEDVLSYVIYAPTRKSELNSQSWKNAMKIAQTALSGQLQDITHGATHFQACDPSKNGGLWYGAYAIKGVSSKGHCFYKGIKDANMVVQGHTFTSGKITGRFSKGGGGVIPVHEGGGTGEGLGKMEQKSLNSTYGKLYKKYGIIPGKSSGIARTGGAEWGDYVPPEAGDDSSGGGYADSGGFTDLTFTDQAYIDACEEAKTEADSLTTTPPNLFNTNILAEMSSMLRTIHVSLGRLYVMGQGLMCFATHKNKIDLKVFKMVNIPYWLTGLAIYLAAFFITVSIGLYFVDVAFKIGFALLMLPISLALWPFEPTRGKLSENFSIIIRNSMLFVLVSIGISFALTLIQGGIEHGLNEADFAQALDDSSVTYIAKQFALSGVNTLIILFCLIYAYLLIQSSIKDYLNRIFPDNVFGGQSPMHELGVQAFGNAATHTVLPLAAFGSDVVRATVGGGLVKAGEGLKNISQRRGPETPTPPTQVTPQPAPTTPSPSDGESPNTSETENVQAQSEGSNNESDRRQQSRQTNSENEGLNPQNIASSRQSAVAANGTHVPPVTPPQAEKPLSALEAFKLGMKNADSSAYSLSAGTILKNTSKVANAPFELLNKKTYTQLAHLDELREKQAQKNAERRSAEDALAPNITNTGRVIMRAGQLFMRTAKDTKNESAYAVGSILSGLGRAIRPDPQKRNNYWQNWWDEHEADKIKEQKKEQAKAETEATLADQYTERE